MPNHSNNTAFCTALFVYSVKVCVYCQLFYEQIVYLYRLRRISFICHLVAWRGNTETSTCSQYLTYEYAHNETCAMGLLDFNWITLTVVCGIFDVILAVLHRIFEPLVLYCFAAFIWTIFLRMLFSFYLLPTNTRAR